MIATAEQVLNSARTYLDDDLGSRFPDEVLMPKLQEAHREMKQVFLLNDIPVVHTVTASITVPALVTDGINQDFSTVTGYPTDLLEPIGMKERQVSQINADFVDMTRVNFIPNVTKDVRLFWWAWITGSIWFLGALNDVQVELRYSRELTPPSKLTDTIGVLMAEIFLSYRTAAKAAVSVGDPRAQMFNSEADRNLDFVIRTEVKSLQDIPVKRRPYHRGRWLGSIRSYP